MTVIKQKGITSVKHGKNLMRYIDNDKALLRNSQNLINPNKWYAEMERTREEFGHDKAKGLSKNTIIHHQMLNFLPEECDMNDGVMTPEFCMNYAKEYAASYYADYQVIFALHKEHCKADDTHRYSVHMAINRSNLMTGNRLDEGRAKVAKQIRAGHVRDMDEKWELSQLKKGVRNSTIHDKQPSRTEREIENSGRFSYKNNLRELMRLAKEETTSLEKWVEKMTEWGVDVSMENDRIYITDTDENKYSFRTDMLNYDFEINKLIKDISTPEHRISAEITRFRREMAQDIKDSRNVATEREKYADEVEKEFAEYKEMAMSMKGVDYKDFPVFRLPRGSEVHNTFELNLLVISLKDRADELRLKYASNVPVSKGTVGLTGHGNNADNGTSKSRGRSNEQNHSHNNHYRSR